MNAQQTIDEIERTITHLDNAITDLTYIGMCSDHVQQARFEQFITTTEETIRSLTKIKENL